MLNKISIIAVLILALGYSATLHAQSVERAPKLPANIASFADKYPMDLFKNAAVKTRLRKLLGKSYAGFMEAIDVQEPFERSGDLLIGKGSAKGLGTIYEAIIVVNLGDKSIHCGIFANQLKQKYWKFSEAPKNFPSVITDWSNNLLEINK